MDNQLKDLYGQRFNGDAILRQKNKMWYTLCVNYFQRWLPLSCNTNNCKSIVVDVAAGYCEFINNIKATYKYAVDLNPDVQKFANEGVTTVVGTISDLVKVIDADTVDAVFLSNFLEHLDSKEQVIDIFAQAKSLLRKGGRILILQPNIKYTGSKYWDFIDHKLPLTENALIECGEIHGFKTVACVKKFLPYTTKSALPKASWIIALYCKLMPFSGWFFGSRAF